MYFFLLLHFNFYGIITIATETFLNRDANVGLQLNEIKCN